MQTAVLQLLTEIVQLTVKVCKVPAPTAVAPKQESSLFHRSKTFERSENQHLGRFGCGDDICAPGLRRRRRKSFVCGAWLQMLMWQTSACAKCLRKRMTAFFFHVSGWLIQCSFCMHKTTSFRQTCVTRFSAGPLRFPCKCSFPAIKTVDIRRPYLNVAPLPLNWTVKVPLLGRGAWQRGHHSTLCIWHSLPQIAALSNLEAEPSLTRGTRSVCVRHLCCHRGYDSRGLRLLCVRKPSD